MTIFLKLLNDYDVWLYGLAAILALFLLRAAIVARRDRLQATFSLEREAARNREYRIMTVAVIILTLLIGLYAVQRFVSPNVEIPYEQPASSPSPFLLPTITPTAAPPTLTPTVTPTLVRPTFAAPIPTATPGPTGAPAAACANAGVRLTTPGVNSQVRGVVQMVGTASIDRFQYYKLEFGIGSNPGHWNFVLSGSAPVTNGPLGQWDTSGLPAGVYTLRLVVVDQTGNFPEPCTVVLNVSP